MLGLSALGAHPIGGYVLSATLSETSARSFELRAEETINAERGFSLVATYLVDRPLNYKVIVYDKSGNKVGQHAQFRSLNFNKRLNNFGQAEFDITLDNAKHLDLVALRENYIEIYREIGTSETLVWAGEQAVRSSHLLENNNNWSTIISYSWFEQLFHRFTDEYERYEDIDAATVIQTLISTTQGLTDGDLGITYGTIGTTYNLDEIYQNDNIGEIIKDIADGGLDFEITDSKVLNAQSVLGTDKTNSVVIEYNHNVKNMHIVEDFSNPVNQALVLGEVISETQLQRVERTDSTNRSKYGLRQARINQMNAAILALFQQKGDALLNKYGTELIKVDFELQSNNSPSIDQFGIGDSVTLIVDDGIYDINTSYRVFEWNVTFGSDNKEKLSLLLGNL